jgi:hypothetical protein
MVLGVWGGLVDLSVIEIFSSFIPQGERMYVNIKKY